MLARIDKAHPSARTTASPLHPNHVVRACSQQLGNAGVQLIPVALHEPVCVILDRVVVVMDRELLQSRVRCQVLLVGDLESAAHNPQRANGSTSRGRFGKLCVINLPNLGGYQHAARVRRQSAATINYSALQTKRYYRKIQDGR